MNADISFVCRLHSVRAFLLAGICASALLLPLPAVAQGGASVTFNIPASNLADALNAYGVQSDQRLAFSSEAVANKRVPELKGSYSAEQALEILLRGTGLTFRRGEGGAYYISIAEPKKSSMNPTASRESSLASASSVEEIIVSAQKRGDERLLDTPIPITVVDPERLAVNDQTHLKDYYASIPSFNMTPAPGTGQRLSLTLRGVPPLGDIPTVGIMIDDAPYGSPAVLSAAQQPVPDIDPGDLARIEVLRGPQGTLYGAGAMGGLIKFVTKDPSTDGFSARVQTSVSNIQNGSSPGYSLRGLVNVPVNEVLAVRASGFVRHDAGYVDNPVLGIRGINQAEVSGGRVSALWSMSDSTSLKLGAIYENTDRKGLNDVNIQPGLGDLQQSYTRGLGFLKAEVQAYSAVLKTDIGKASITSISGYNSYKQNESLDVTGSYGSNANRLYGVGNAAIIADRKTRKFVQEIRVSTPLGENFDLLAGVFYTHEDTALRIQVPALTAAGSNVGLIFDRRVPSTYDEYAAFADLTYHFSDRFEVQLGARQGHIKQTAVESIVGPDTQVLYGAPSPVIRGLQEAQADSFTYLVSPSFKVSADMMVYARFASGYRPGNVNLSLSPAALAAGVPPQFNPDKTQTYEGGIKADLFDKILTIDASIYYIDWSEIQMRFINPQTTASYTFNGTGAKSQGAELSLQLRPVEDLSISGWISYNDAALTETFPVTSPVYGVTGNRLPWASKFSASISVEQSFPLWGDATGFVGGQANFVGDRLGLFRGLSAGTPLPRQYYPSYVQTDLRAGINHDTWSTNFYINNVGNARGVVGGGVDAFPPNAFIYIQPRTVGASIVKTF